MTEIAARLTRPIRRLSWPATIALFLALLLAAAGAYTFARALSFRNAVLPGVTVASVDVGGLSAAEAQAKIETRLEPRLARTVRVSVGEGSFVVRPDQIWSLDAAATEQRAYQAGRESVQARLGALLAPFAFGKDVQPVLDLRPAERRKLQTILDGATDRPVNATLEMDGTQVVVEPGRAGTAVDVDALLDSIRSVALLGAGAVSADIKTVQPSITTDEARAIALQAETVVAAPVGVRFRSKRVGALGPADLAALIRFERDAGTYRVALDDEGLRDALLPLVKARTRDPVDASFKVVGKRVRVVKARPGTTLDTERAQAAVLSAALEPGVRIAPIALTKLPADFTTKEAKALGIRRQISTFTTDMGESSANRIWNVHLLGDYLDGTIVKAGQTFSYNKEVGPRTVERGFREGQMIFGGVLIPSIGGGVCQTATTVFNAAFEAGLPIKERTNHSFYISHYPLGRDATVSWGGPDLVFRNDLEHAVLIKVTYTDYTFTVSFYGTRQGRKVVSTTSSPTNYTQPKLQYAVDPSAPPNSLTTTSAGGPGFDVNVHRKVFQDGKLLREDDFFTRYVPQNPTAIYGPGRTPPGPFFYLPSSA
jgi:vancomycin resistance protein YoaR